MAKFYAVQKGFGGPAVYGTWNECKEHVDGYSGAVYKSFPTEDEARAFAFGDSGRKKQPSIPVDIVAYTDGSFDSSDKWNPKSGFAAILLRGTLETATWLGCIYGPCRKDPAIRNIGGELEAAEQAIRYAINHGYKHIHIFHDYIGVGSWANGLWKTNRVDTGAYVQFIQKARRNIAISFTHLHGHSGLVYNELADSYAKAGSENSEIQYF